MRTEVVMPSLGYEMESGRVHAWLKEVGESVVRGEAIAEIETDKTTIEIEATTAGVLIAIVRGAGEEVAVGEALLASRGLYGQDHSPPRCRGTGARRGLGGNARF